MSSYSLIQKKLQLEYELPVTENWSASADFLFLIAEYCLNYKPETIVECSSGLTTLVLARCCQLNNYGQVISLENGEEYVTRTQDILNQFSVSDYAQIIHAPLQTISINEQDYLWYKTDDLSASKINMLVIDGPPGFIQKHSRFPALPILYNRLENGTIIFMDDAARDDEKEIINMWLKMSTAIEHEYIETERGCSVLKTHKHPL